MPEERRDNLAFPVVSMQWGRLQVLYSAWRHPTGVLTDLTSYTDRDQPGGGVYIMTDIGDVFTGRGTDFLANRRHLLWKRILNIGKRERKRKRLMENMLHNTAFSISNSKWKIYANTSPSPSEYDRKKKDKEFQSNESKENKLLIKLLWFVY